MQVFIYNICIVIYIVTNKWIYVVKLKKLVSKETFIEASKVVDKLQRL